MLRRDVGRSNARPGELLKLAEQNNATYWALWARPMLGWIKAQEGNIDAGIQEMHQSTAALQEQGANLWVPQTLLLEAEILGRAGHCQNAYRLLDEAQALIEPLDQRFYEAELHRVRGMVMLAEDSDFDAVAANLIVRPKSRAVRAPVSWNCARPLARHGCASSVVGASLHAISWRPSTAPSPRAWTRQIWSKHVRF